METLLLKQEDMLERLMKALSNYKKSPKERLSSSYIESRAENLEKLWGSFENVHLQLVSTVKKEDRTKVDYFSKDIYGSFEDFYTEYKTKLKDDMKRFNVTFTSKNTGSEQSESTAMAKCEAKLPQIQLPKFSGAYEDWQGFYDMFLSLIHHNNNLSAVQKLHYLKSGLSGEPENLLKNLSTTETNYDEAWSQLIRRYNNKRYNSNEVLKRLFSQRSLSSESATSIKQLLDTTSACLKALNNMGIQTEAWDTIINYLVVSKLDNESRKYWELQLSQFESDDLPTWNQLVKFLETRFRTLEMIDVGKQVKPAYSYSPNKQMPKQKSFHATVEENKRKIACVMCPEQHLLYMCPQFSSQSPQERTEFIQSKRLCFNCFSSNHAVKDCRQPVSCRRCGRRHHTMLHYERSNNQDITPVASTSPVSVESQSTATEKKINTHFSRDGECEVLLATARVRAVSGNGFCHIVRALIDQGSEASFVTEATVQYLGLKRVPVNGLISGVGDGETRTKSMVTLKLESLHKPEFSIQVNAFVLSSLTSFLPTSKTVIRDWATIENLTLADPQYGSPERVDLILGVEVLSEIILSGLVKHPRNPGPIAQNTQFGWILSGRIDCDPSLPNRRVINMHIKVKEDDLSKRFWEIERARFRIQEPDQGRKTVRGDL